MVAAALFVGRFALGFLPQILGTLMTGILGFLVGGGASAVGRIVKWGTVLALLYVGYTVFWKK